VKAGWDEGMAYLNGNYIQLTWIEVYIVMKHTHTEVKW
jgi:hypothetical protein